ncbi:TVP38/TMEM64 family protein [Palleronia abyssalis]|uniref:TVP38/TMEM64 family membrane protein n=1 Tax=Palleronia abyssalis TaxID=1501240 RepID=A0A2R8BR36_9RHOB|nr:VTT domain-containing protein [Palleronia abyssalis]SPJ22546.1 TVP38/TMEM64 family inner membrane protein YdjZ [Palleronia abyssalis]
MTSARTIRFGAFLALALAGVAVVVFWDAPVIADLRSLAERENIERLVARAGAWGPAVIVLAMIVAVVASPIPSAPIAMAAGAAYGHVYGTMLVVAGAETGALIAFALARFLGRETIRRWLGDGVERGLVGSQNALTLAVFLSRLMPFVSFDIVSYAAGLSAIHFWRFAVATLAGIVPASFVLSHLGTAAMSGGDPMTWVIAALGLVTGLPLIWAVLRRRRG